MQIKWRGGCTAVAVPVSLSGGFPIGQGEGDITISAYKVDSTTGVLTPIGSSLVDEGSPSPVAVDPSGKFLFAWVGDHLALFGIDQSTGPLTRLGRSQPLLGILPRFTIVRLQ